MSARSDYIDKYKQLAVDTTAGTGLFPSVMLAQGIVESNSGQSALAKNYNNHFGIKADSSWNGKKVNMQTREVVSGKSQMQGAYFRAYNNARDGFQDRVNFLINNPRYRNAGVFSAKTPIDQLKALQSAGYATDPQYAEIIDSVLKKEDLGVIDFIKAHPKAIALGLVTVALIGTTVVYYFVNRKKIEAPVLK